MKWFPSFGSQRRKRDLQEEIDAHLQMAIADRVARGETPETLGVVPVVTIRDAFRVQPTACGRFESDARAEPGKTSEGRASDRSLCEIRDRIGCAVVRGLESRRAELRRDVRETAHSTRAASLVVDGHSGDVRIAREQRRAGWRRDHVHRSTPRELGHERRGEDDAPEKRSLDDEGELHRACGGYST